MMAVRRNRARFVTNASRFGAGMAVALGLLQWALGSQGDALVGAVCAAICLAAAVNPQRVEQGIGLHLVIGALTVTFGTVILLGSIAYISWLGTVSVLAIMLLGRRAGLAWTVVIFVVLLCAVWIVSLPGATTMLSPGPPLVRLVRAVSAVPTMAVIGLMFEAQRRDDIAALEQAVRARARLLANVSHEMRTPLNGIIGMVESLRAEPLAATVRERLDVIHFSGETLLALINELLDVTRAETAAHVVLAPADACAIVARSVELHRPRAEREGRTLTLKLPPAPVHVSCDAVRIQQVVGNLVANALRHGGPHIEVRLTATPETNRTTLRVEVADDGPGISAQQEAHLFQPFAQLNPLTAMGGSGMGLFISRSIARMLGGELTLGPQPGCCFIFTLSAERAEAPPTVEPVTLPPLALTRVMVVDDNVINRKVAAALLQRYGLSVVTADAGEAAIESLQHQSVDLVFMDLQMPGIDGLEATRRLRTGGYAGAIVALTASAEPEIARQCEAAGMNAVLLKPLQVRALEPLLARLLAAPAVHV
jgi:signal transduction histidine kinase